LTLESFWIDVPVLTRHRFAQIWSDLPSLTVLAAFPGWGRTTLLDQCVAYLETNARGTRIDQVVTRSQLQRSLHECAESAESSASVGNDDARRHVVIADGLIAASDDPLWAEISAALAAYPHLRVVTTSVDTPAAESIAGVETLTLTERELAFTRAEVEELVELVTGRRQTAMSALVGDGLYGQIGLIARQLRARLVRSNGAVWDAAEIAPEVQALELTNRRPTVLPPMQSHLLEALNAVRELRSFSKTQLKVFLEHYGELSKVGADEAYARFRQLPFFVRSTDFEVSEERLVWAPVAWRQLMQQSTAESRRAGFERGLASARSQGRLVGELFYLVSLERFDEANDLAANRYHHLIGVLEPTTATLLSDTMIDGSAYPALAILRAEVRFINGASVRESRDGVEVAVSTLEQRTATSAIEALSRTTLLAYGTLALGDRARSRRYLAYVIELMGGQIASIAQSQPREVRAQIAGHASLLVWAALMADEPLLSLRFARESRRYSSVGDHSHAERLDALVTLEDLLGLRSTGASSVPAGYGIIGNLIALRHLDEGHDERALDAIGVQQPPRVATAAKTSHMLLGLVVRAIAQPQSVTQREIDAIVRNGVSVWGSAEPTHLAAFGLMSTLAMTGNKEAAADLAEALSPERHLWTDLARVIWAQWCGEFQQSIAEIDPSAIVEAPRFAVLARVLVAASQLRLDNHDLAVIQLAAAWQDYEAPTLVRFALRFVPEASFAAFRELAPRLPDGLVEVLDAAVGDVRSITWQMTQPLTRSEREIMTLLAGGLKNSEIAKARHVTVGTVRSQLKSIYRKLGVSGRASAIAQVRGQGAPAVSDDRGAAAGDADPTSGSSSGSGSSGSGGATTGSPWQLAADD
jgi:DNA-binding CsgD family transcriptional regulator